MKNFRSKNGIVKERPYFEAKEIEEICTSELKKVGLLPSEPEQIRIDRFIEKRFGISPKYEDTKDGILGFTVFGPKGVEEIFVAKSLENENNQVSERRIRTTLAHEAGHGLLHAYLFTLGKTSRNLFNEEQPEEPKIFCREVATHKYDGNWWEFQANKAMASLLLPKMLVYRTVKEFFTSTGMMAREVLDESKRITAINEVSEIFNVNFVVAQFRLSELYPLTDSFQLSL